MGTTYVYVERDDDHPGSVIVAFGSTGGGCVGWPGVVDGFVALAESLSRRAGRLFDRLDRDKLPGRGARFRMSLAVCTVVVAWMNERHRAKVARGDLRLEPGAIDARHLRAGLRWLRAHEALFGLDGPVEAF
jgi:hypothetical protein